MRFGYEVVEGSRAGTVLDNLEVTVYRRKLSGDDACAPRGSNWLIGWGSGRSAAGAKGKRGRARQWS